MAHSTAPRLHAQFHRFRTQTSLQPELGLAGIPSEADIRKILTEEGAVWKSVFFTPWVTFWTFFWQALSPDRSCRSALKRLAAWMASHGLQFTNEDTSPYCKARMRLPESALRRLTRTLGRELHRTADAEGWQWCGRRVKLVDGSTAIMPDTKDNQREYPQSPSQKPGLGFPITRFVAVFCLKTGAMLDLALGKYQGKETGEHALFRSLYDSLEPEDVVLGDHYYGSYFNIAMLMRRGVDSVFGLHQRRPRDYSRGRRLGKEDQIVIWTRPARPDWMDQETYNQIPETMEIRQVRIRIEGRGFRTKVLDLATTLLDPEKSTKADLGLLFRQRWHVELDLRSTKIVLGMDMLRCKTPEMVRKEIWMILLGYNVVRALMLEASREHGHVPRRLSFKGALQTLQEFAPGLRTGSPAQRDEMWTILLMSIADDEVGNRPDRIEPRARKRRPKQYPLLTKPRDEARASLLHSS